MDRGTETGKRRGGTAIGRQTAARGAGMAALILDAQGTLRGERITVTP